MCRLASLSWCLWLSISLCTMYPAVAGEPEQTTASTPSAAQETPELEVLVPAIAPKIRQLLQDRNYPEALDAIQTAMGQSGAPVDYLTYLQGRALFLQGEYAKAAQTFRLLDSSFPKSPWRRRARFDAALAHARDGNFKAAEAIYRQEAEYLFGPDRRQQIAEVYLEFAEAAFKPEDALVEPDYKKALTFYLAALDVGLKPERQPEIEMLVGRCHQHLDDLEAAIDDYSKFLKDHPQSDQALEARFRLGQCQLDNDSPEESRRTWQDLLASHADSPSPRIAEATFRLAETWGIPKPPNTVSLDLGIGALQAFLKRFPDHEKAATAQLWMGESYLRQQQFTEATECFQAFLADPRFAGKEQIPQARNLLGDTLLLQKKYNEAIAVWREFLATHTTDKHWNAVQRKIINAEFLRATEAYHAEAFEKAREACTQFAAQYPLDERCPSVLLLLGQIARRQEKWEDALTAWKQLVSKYPGHDKADEAQLRIARTLEQDLHRFEEALQAYQKVSQGSKKAKAQHAILRLREKHLAIATERVFRTDEPARLRLTTRNIEAVTVRVYPIDMETFFRKMHRAPGLEQLDTTLIDPDETIEFEVPDYEKYLEIDSTIELPFAENTAGVMAVTVSSRRREATTLVIRSDLDMIVKSSRNELFVFAENMRTGKAWPGVRLLVSDGKTLLAEGESGDDGVFHESLETLAGTDSLCVLALSDDHVASNAMDLSGLSVAQGLEDEGYLYTDRPAYRAGEEVRLRGWIRRAANDKYVVDEGGKYTLQVFDVRNRMLREREIVLSRFGTFDDRFILPATAPQGEYRLLLRDAEDRSFQGSFTVVEYKSQPIRLVVDSPRRVYYRGETIEGTIRAEYYYGAAVAGQPLLYRLADGAQQSAVTDAEGLVHFSFPTREFLQSQTLTLETSLPRQNVQTAANFYLATQGYSIELSTVRDVFLSGESFELTARTITPEGKPTVQPLSFKVFERTSVAGKAGERLVGTHEMTTDEAGVARLSLTLKTSGNYILRAEGSDRFGNPVSERTDVTVSGSDDEVRLRILADCHTYKAGDQTDIPLHWRGPAALALVTFQGARILDYRLVELKTGANTVPITFDADLAPNFELSVALMSDGDRKAEPETTTKRFHEARSMFGVQRDLVVTLECQPVDKAQKSVRPGDRIEVAITTTDPQGKPVSADVSLAMIEQSLLDRFPWSGSEFSTVFQGLPRESQMQTESSISFQYQPRTVPIAPQLLSEQERIEIAREEEDSRQSDPGGNSDDEPYGYGGLGGMAGMGGGYADPFGDMGGATESNAASMGEANPAGSLMLEMYSPGDDPFASPDQQDFETNLGLVIQQTEELVPAGRELKAYGSTVATATRPLRESYAAGYWNPTVVTDENGHATIAFDLPEASTAWRLLAKGLTVDTLVGQAEEPLVVKKDLFGQLRLPLAFTDCDRADIPVIVHHAAEQKAPIEVTLKTTIGGRSVEETQKIEPSATGISELQFSREFLIPDAKDLDPAASSDSCHRIDFELTVTSGDQQDRLLRSIPLLPYGAQVFAARSGSATGDTTAWIEPPESMALASPSLKIVIGPTVQQSLLDAVLDSPADIDFGFLRCSSPTQHTTANLMAALALQDLLAKSGGSDRPEMLRLDRVIRAAIASLVASQKKEGGWNWAGEENQTDRNVTARALWALSTARAAGYVVPEDDFLRAAKAVNSLNVAADNADWTSKAVLLHASTMAGQADFNLANRLHRVRNELSTSALLHLALTYAAMDRPETGQELLKILAGRNLDDTAAAKDDWPVADLHALYALAVQEVSPASEEAGKQVAWLLANRTGRRWSPDSATGPAVMALGRWLGANRFETERFHLDVFVGKTKVGAVEADVDSPSQTIDVPPSLLTEGRQEIRFHMTGRGRYTYQCLLTGFVPAGKLRSTTGAWVARRVYEPAPLEVDGREIERGFRIVQGNAKRFRNPITQLPVGQRAIVLLGLQRQNKAQSPSEPAEYLVIHETIPSGTEVVADSVTGPFEHYEIVPGGLTFYVGNQRQLGTIQYELHGVIPGAYRAAPTLVRNADHPDQMCVAEATALTVIPAGEKSSDPYRLSPVELLDLGTHYYNQGQYEQAAKHLGDLVAHWPLLQSTYQKVVRMLLDIHLELGPPEEIVRNFEIVIERWPEEEITFEKVLKIGAAYEKMGEYERSYMAFRGTVEGRFMKELSVGGFLEEQNEFLRSVNFVGRLLQEYPSEGYAATAAFSLAQRVYSKASEAATSERLRAAKITRIDLIRHGVRMLADFLTAFPEDPAADQAAFARANALLEMEAYDEAVAACNRYAERYPKSDLLDSFWYVIAYCQFAAGRYEAALEMCHKVSEATRIDPATGREVEARNKWLAIYILGQIYHTLNQPEKAIVAYRRVADRFADAQASIDDFLRQRIHLPELTTITPGEPVEIDLEFRNLASCDVKVYGIDLMKFSLLRRDLGGISNVNLAGVRPRHDQHIDLGNGLDYQDRTHKLTLPLKEEGAYLVVCRGDDLHTSGLVILSPLSLTVHQDPESGEVRTSVKNEAEDRCERDVHVKVIGSRNADFVSGKTDFRGIFVAEGVLGSATVIAMVEPSRYALHRGAEPVASAMAPMQVELPPTATIAGGVALDTDEAGARIRAVLNSPTTVNFKEASLREVAAYFSALHKISVKLEFHALEDVAMSPDAGLVTAELSGVSLRSALRIILGELDLTYVIRDEILMITTREEAELQLATKLYPVGDLVGYKDPSGQSWSDFDTLIELINSTVEPESWEEVGGPGAISPIQFQGTDVICIRQTDEVHDEIAKLLARMREMAGRRDGEEPPVRERPAYYPGMSGMGGGGMGGMGGGFGAPSGRNTDLLQGLQGTNRELRGQQMKKFDKMYKEGGFGGSMGGMGAGFF